ELRAQLRTVERERANDRAAQAVVSSGEQTQFLGVALVATVGRYRAQRTGFRDRSGTLSTIYRGTGRQHQPGFPGAPAKKGEDLGGRCCCIEKIGEWIVERATY